MHASSCPWSSASAFCLVEIRNVILKELWLVPSLKLLPLFSREDKIGQYCENLGCLSRFSLKTWKKKYDCKWEKGDRWEMLRVIGRR